MTLVLNSCSKFTPSGFWKNFHSELIEKKSSDQGPFGGTREIEWENTNEKLKDIDFLKYRTTGKGLAKAGIRRTEIPTKPEPSKNHFRFFKITKNKKTKWFFAAKIAEIF